MMSGRKGENMSLTPMDIHNKEFDIKMRGYDKMEVDSFLDRVVDAFGDALDANIDLKNENKSLKKKIQEYEKIKDSLNESLISAQRNSDEIKAKAQKEADDLIKGAKQQAADRTKKLQQDYDTLSSDYELLKGKVTDFRMQTAKLLQDQLNELNDNDWQYYLDKYYGRARLYPADGGQPILADDPANNPDAVAVDKNPASEVESKQDSEEKPEIIEGDAPKQEMEQTPQQPDMSEGQGPTIIFPSDYKNHN